MSNISVDYDVLNQRGSPAWFTDTFANIPTAGFVGRMFISKDTFAFYRDTGSGWDLIGGPGTGTITGSGVAGQVSYFNGTQTLAGSNNLFWDNTNGRLGIGTTTPSAFLDIHATGTNATFNGTGTSNASLVFQNAGASKWTIGNSYSAGSNLFIIYNNTTSASALSIDITTNAISSNGTGIYGGVISLKQGIITAGLGYTTLGASSAGQLVIYFGDTNLYGATILNTSLTASRSYTLPNATGTLALTSDLSSYVPYTGATGAVNLGAYNLTINNIILGAGAGSGSNNVTIGTGMTSNTTGTSNTSLGNSALGSNTTGSFNTAIGQGSLQANLGGNLNTSIGQGSLLTNLNGINNTAVGQGTLNLSTGSNNTAIGQASGSVISSGTNNTLLGYLSGSAITSGSNNTIIGNYAGTSALANNIVLADGAGTIRYQWDGTANTFANALKTNSTLSVTGVSTFNNNLDITKGSNAVIGTTDNFALIFKTNATDRVTIFNSGNVAINSSTDSGERLQVTGTIRANGNITMQGSSCQFTQTIANSLPADNAMVLYNSSSTGNGIYIGAGGSTSNALYLTNYTRANLLLQVRGDGQITTALGTGTVTSTSGVLSVVSDMNLKIDAGIIENGLDKVMKLKPRYFYWKKESSLPTDIKQLGFYAQEVNEALGEEVVNTPKKQNEEWGIYDRGMIAMLTKAIQELNDKLIRNNIN